MPKREPPETQAGGSIEDTILQPHLDSLRLQIAKAVQFIEYAQRMASELEALLEGRGMAPQHQTVGNLPYVGWDMIDAITDLLDERGHALSREEIIETVLSRGVYVGKGVDAKGAPELQVGKSIKYHLLTREQKQEVYKNRKKKIKAKPAVLREMNGLIGRAGWGDEKFVVPQ